MDRQLNNIICISSIDWGFIWQGHQEIMSRLAREGNRVLFVENTGVRNITLKDFPRLRQRFSNWRRGVKGIRKVMDNLYVYAPLILPFPYSGIARWINKAVMAWTIRGWVKTMQFDNPIVWTWLPTGLALELIRVVAPKLVVYYCIDNFQASSEGSQRIRETEDLMIRRADLVFVTSKALFDRCSQFTDRVHLFPYGFNRTIFARENDLPVPDLEVLRRPILGYVGGVHKVVDYELVEQLAAAHPDKSLVFIGPIQTDVGRLDKFPNVHFLGQKPYELLPSYIRRFDVCLIPYVLNEYTKNVYPTKMNEYLIMGKPVLSTSLPEVVYFNQTHQGIVSIADKKETFISQIDEVLVTDSEALHTKRIKLVEKNAWDGKIEAMMCLIEVKLSEKAKTRELNWQSSFLRLYQASRRKTTVAAALFVIFYVLLFHTPMVWMLAEPLRIEDPPTKADVIVVLAGGIGESGEPGDEYQEKVRQAAELYKQGYAGRLIVSSGATYVFKEARIMKALAMSLGVPDENIILEERGGGNYASFFHVSRIMGLHGWHDLLLVTSRYNGARSRLVAEKNFSEYRVTITPARHSLFFGDEDHVEWKHVRAVAHEYLGIVYYWLKGYI